MSTQPHVFTACGEQFVTGLLWQPLSGTSGGDITNEIRQLSQETDLDLFVHRTTVAHCAGFAKSGGDVKTGILSAAAAVAKAVEIESGSRDFIFVAPLPEGVWLYVSQREGILLPDGDTVFPSEDAVRARLLEDLALDNWSTIIAPAIFGLPHSLERSFEDMLPRKPNGKLRMFGWWRLRPAQSSIALALYKKQIAIGLICAAIAVGAGYKYLDYKKMQQELSLALAAKDARDREVAEIAKRKPPPPPWAALPPMREVARACREAIVATNLFPGNWKLDGAHCSGSGDSWRLVVTWKPSGQYSWISHLTAVEPDASIATDGSSASKVVALQISKDDGGDFVVETPGDLLNEGDRLMEMYSAAQRYGVALATSDAPVEAPVALPGEDGAKPKPPAWKEVTWRVSNVALPEVVVSAFGAGSGIRMKSMAATWQKGSLIWVMEGSQYVAQ